MKAPVSDLARKVLLNRENKKALEDLADGKNEVIMFYMDGSKKIEVLATVIKEVSIAL